MLRLHLDRPRNGSHYSDRMHSILGVCHACGILWHEEKITYRDGKTEMHRLEDVRPAGEPQVTPQYERYGLHVNPRVLPKLRGMAPQFAYALNVPAVSVEVDGDVVWVRVPRERGAGEDVVLFEQAWALAPDIPPGSLLLGVDEDAKQLLVDMDAPGNVHCAVIGMSGSGKSTLMRAMILSAEMCGGSKIALFDPSGMAHPLSGHPSVWRGGLFRRVEECEIGLEILARGLFRESADSQRSYIFVDEVPELVRERPAIKGYLEGIAQAGRQGGYHLVLGAQHPLSSELGAATLRNIPLRLVGHVADKGAAYNATGRSDTGAELLKGGGDFIAVNGATKRHFQAAMPGPALLEQWVQRYPPRPPRIPPRPASPPISLGSLSLAASRGPGGSTVDAVPGELLAAIWRYYQEQGEPPKRQWVRDITKERFGGEYNYVKSGRAIYWALAVHGVAYDGYDPNSQETARTVGRMVKGAGAG